MHYIGYNMAPLYTHEPVAIGSIAILSSPELIRKMRAYEFICCAPSGRPIGNIDSTSGNTRSVDFLSFFFPLPFHACYSRIEQKLKKEEKITSETSLLCERRGARHGTTEMKRRKREFWKFQRPSSYRRRLKWIF